MSYILDALKKAESERKLGSVPTSMRPHPMWRWKRMGRLAQLATLSLAAATLAVLLLAWHGCNLGGK